MLEVPEIALQELLVNALVHRDYFTSASIRILVFRDRIEIISPGPLPDSLSIEDIRHGKSNRRNPTLSEHAFRLLPYRGMGSGIPRALGEWPQIELISELSGNQFTALVRRLWVQRKDSTDPVTEQVEAPVALEPESRPESRLESRLESKLAAKVVLMLDAVAQGKLALARGLGHQSVSGELNKQIRRLLESGLIELTIPDKLNSRLQQYRLTDKGKNLLR
jgi:predicted HTH transcriptional regulator